MAIVKMKFVATNTDANHLDDMLLAIVKSNLFHPEPAINIITEDNGGKLISNDNVYSDYLVSLKNIGHHIGIDLHNNTPSTKEYTHEEIESFITEMDEKVSLAVVLESSYLTQDDNIALQKLNEYGYEKIHNAYFTQYNFGRLPIESYKKLSLYQDEPFLIDRLHENNQYYWVLYASSVTHASKINRIFDSLFLERIPIPNIDVKDVVDEYETKLKDVYAYCSTNNELHQLYQYVFIMDNKHVICGFVPKDKIEEYKSNFKDIPVDFRVKDPNEMPRATPPTQLKNNWFFKPFEMFVDMYSIPGYHEIDPTVFVGITYCLLFGLMFGDLGQGSLLFIIGTYMYMKNKNQSMWGIVSRIGLTSMIFGFLFGSVFGNEHILNPIHQSLFNVREKLFEVMATSSTMVLLIGAVSIGAILILITISINIYINLKNKHIGEALFSQNGIAGFVFYSYILIAIVCNTLYGINLMTPMFLVPFVGIPVFLFFFKEPLEKILAKENPKPHAGWGNFVLETVFEVFEIMLSFVTNSLSYLRVGGFILSHAGMMLVVMTLVEMTGNAGPVVLIIGNLFVIALEGLIVGIQTLRLEYYEMFSRYYKGGGKKYQILTYED